MNLVETSFTSEQLSILLPSLAFIILSIGCYAQKRYTLALSLLMVGALGLRLFMIILDPFLNEWDERYHALVAKNMMHHPFVPTLWPKAILPYNYQEWCCNYYWLHKQPLFLWQMALSMKIFGVNEVALRLPSAILSTLQVLLTYRMGVLLHDKKLGYLAAFLITFSYYGLEQVSGAMGREHNDVASFFYLTASFWALAEYLNKPRPLFLLLIGLCSGAAILNKWLVGLLVYAGWGLGVILAKKDFWFHLKSMAVSVVVTILTFLPWQIYIFAKFPLESEYEFYFNGKHITEAVEGHSGDIWYYFTNNFILYGEWSGVLILAGLFLFVVKIKKSIFKYALVASTIVIYAFFSIAKTKIISFVFVSPFIFIFMGMLLLYVQEVLEKRIPKFPKPAIITMIVLAGFYTLRHKRIEEYHARSQPNYYGYGPQRIDRIQDAETLRQLKKEIDPEYLIVNTTQPVETMFYTENVAYFWIDPKDHDRLKEKKHKIATMRNRSYPMPRHLEQDSTILNLDIELRN